MPKVPKPKSSIITVRLGSAMKQQVETYAGARDMTVGEFIRYTVWTYIDSNPVSVEDLANEHR